MLTNTRAVDLLLKHMESGARAFPATGPTPHAPDYRVANFSLAYLSAFGYLKNEITEWKDITLQDILLAVRDFKGRFGLLRTDAIDVPTVRAMEAPRCGCPDVIRERHKCARRLMTQTRTSLPKWKKTGLTYAVTEYPPGVDRAAGDAAVAAAFAYWTRHSALTVTPAGKDKPDILIGTGRGPQSNFDGAGGTLAWAFVPDGRDRQLQMKFDADETWVFDPAQRGFLLQTVACHEFGHLLGLDHSRVQSALMAPHYNATIGEPQPNDDVARFQTRYGPHQNPTAQVPEVGITTPPGVRVRLNGTLV